MCPTQSDKSMDQSQHHAEKKKATKIAQNWHSIKAIQTTTNKKPHYYMYFKTYEQLNMQPTIPFTEEHLLKQPLKTICR